MLPFFSNPTTHKRKDTRVSTSVSIFRNVLELPPCHFSLCPSHDSVLGCFSFQASEDRLLVLSVRRNQSLHSPDEYGGLIIEVGD